MRAWSCRSTRHGDLKEVVVVEYAGTVAEVEAA